MKILSWYKSKSMLVKIFVTIIAIVIVVLLSIFVYLSTYHKFSEVYKICENKIEINMSREQAKEIMLPLLENSFSNSGFTDDELDLYIMDKKGIYCEVKIENDKVIDSWWGSDAP